MSVANKETELVQSPTRGFAWTLIITGIVGWLAAFALVLERLHVAADPNATLSCDVNIFISCKSVMLTPQAKLLGFPNPIIGLAAFIAPIIVGVAILAGARFALWFWRTFVFGITAGFVFVLWLFTQSTYAIHVLCPYCMLAWAAMVPLFWKVILWAASVDVIQVPERFIGFFVRAYDWSLLFTIATEVLVLAAIVVAFWEKWYLLFV